MLVGFILAAQRGAITFYDAGVVQIVFGVLTPAGVFAIVMIADFWVQTLPAQVRTHACYAYLWLLQYILRALYDAGVVQIAFGVLTPAGAFVVVMIADVWVQTLREQVRMHTCYVYLWL